MPQNPTGGGRSVGGATGSGSSGVAVTEGGSAMALERLRAMLNVPPANRPPDWINPLEKIEQLLTCAICLDRYKNPKLLPCQHSFCMDPCLDGLIDIVRRLVRCPECRAEHPLPYDGVKAFQTNYTLMGFLEIHLQATEENASELESYIRRYNLERCKVCDEKSEVDYCPHCEKRICLECKATHVDMLKRDLGRLMNQVKRLCTRLTDTADTLGRGAESLTVNCDNVKEEVRDYVKRYVKELKKREDALVSEVDTFFNAETRMIKTVRDNLELESSNISEACTRVEACLKGDREMSDEELVRYKQMFSDGLEYLRTVNPDADDLTNKKIRFVVNDAHLLPHAITQFGELQVCTPQYNHKLAQADQIYVPRFFQLGLESDNYATKKRMWDPNDSNTWQQQQQQQGMKAISAPQKSAEDDAYSSRYRRRQLLEEQAWNRIRGEHPQQQQQRQQRHSPKRTQEDHARQPMQFDSSPWSRMQRMDQAQVAPSATPAPTPVPVPAEVSPGTTGAEVSPPVSALPPLPRRQLIAPAASKTNLKPPQPKKTSPEQQGPTTEEGSPAAPAPSPVAESAIPRLSPRSSKPPSPAVSPASSAKTSPEKTITSSESGSSSSGSGTGTGTPAAAPPKEKSNSEDRELDKRVANIRKEHEQRQQEQQKTILQIQQKVRAHRLPVDVASAATASSEDEEEEEEEDDDDKGESIPVHVYPKPVEPVAKLERKSSDETSSIERPLHVTTSETASGSGAATNTPEAPRKFSYPLGKPPTPQQQTNGGIDWKKYLIPSPPDSGNKGVTSGRRQSATTAASSTSAVSDVIQRQTELPSSIPRFTDETSWSERRRRFVRSKTNPDFSGADPAPAETTRPNRYLADNSDLEQRRRRYGLRSDSTGSPERHGITSNTTSSTADQRTGPAKTRYRRKAERSHSGYAMTTGGGLSDDSEHEPQRFEISIGGGSEANSGPGARFYRVFTNPKIDYLSKGRCLMKFGCKGNADGQFNWPRGVATMPTTEEIVVCDSSNHRLQIFDKRGRFQKTLGTYGTGRAEFDCLAGVCINKYRQYVITDRYNHRVQIFDSTGRHLREFGAHGQTNGRFNSPWGVAVDQQGFIYVCDKDNHRVQIFQADGNFVGKFGGIGNREGQFQNPHFVACNRQNQLIVTDSSNHRVQVFDHNGHFLFTFGSEGFHEGQFKYPRGLAVDEQGFIVVADSGNNRIQVFYPDGRFYSTFGQWGSADGQLKGVEGVAITADGKIIVTDRENHRVQVF